MKKATVTISFDQEKLKAVQFYAGKTGTSLESDLDEFMEKLYKRYVPDEQTRQRPPRASRSAVPDALGTGKEARE